jgi:hypothetical protein
VIGQDEYPHLGRRVRLFLADRSLRYQRLQVTERNLELDQRGASLLVQAGARALVEAQRVGRDDARPSPGVHGDGRRRPVRDAGVVVARIPVQQSGVACRSEDRLDRVLGEPGDLKVGESWARVDLGHGSLDDHATVAVDRDAGQAGEGGLDGHEAAGLDAQHQLVRPRRVRDLVVPPEPGPSFNRPHAAASGGRGQGPAVLFAFIGSSVVEIGRACVGRGHRAAGFRA